MSLRKKQSKFARMIADLILYAYENGYELTFGHAYRCQDCKVGMANSLHKVRLAVDLNLFRDGRYLTSTDDYHPLGVFWESLDQKCAWGGRFTKPDGNHFSMEHDGRK